MWNLQNVTFQSEVAKQKKSVLFSTRLMLPVLSHGKFQAPLGAKPVSISYKKTKNRPQSSLPESCKVSWYSSLLKWNVDDTLVNYYLSYAYTLGKYINEKEQEYLKGKCFIYTLI